MKVYLDSVIIIYYLDHVGSFQARATNRLAVLKAAGDQIASSDLVRMECRSDPMRKGENRRLARFDGFFAQRDVEIVPITTAVFDRATEIRAAHGYKAMDSINLAVAVEAGCDSFLTNDVRLRGFPGIYVEVLP